MVSDCSGGSEYTLCSFRWWWGLFIAPGYCAERVYYQHTALATAARSYDLAGLGMTTWAGYPLGWIVEFAK